MMTRFVIPMTLEMLEKARKSPRLIPVTRMVTRGGKTFHQTVWMLPADVKAGKTAGAQGSLFDDVGPAPVVQGDLFDETSDGPTKDDAYWQKEVDRLTSLSEKIYREEKDPKSSSMPDKFYDVLTELREAKEKLNAALDEKTEARKNTPEYKNEQEKAKQAREREFSRKQRENEVTSTTHENWLRRKEKEVSNMMGSRGAGMASKPQDVSGVRMADGDFPKDVLRDGEKIGRITEARLNGKVVGYNVRNLQGELVGNAKTPEEALEHFKGGIKKEEPTEPDAKKPEGKLIEKGDGADRNGSVVQDETGNDWLVMSSRSAWITACPIINGKPHVNADEKKTFHLDEHKIYDTGKVWDYEENKPVEKTENPDKNLPVGSTKTENGVTYRLNENSRWERVGGEDSFDKERRDLVYTNYRDQAADKVYAAYEKAKEKGRKEDIKAIEDVLSDRKLPLVQKKNDGQTPEGTYKYLMRLRPFGGGAQPEGKIVGVEPADKTKDGGWSVVEYMEPLSLDQLEHFSMEPYKDASKSTHEVGESIWINGVQYRLNANHRWEKVDTEEKRKQVPVIPASKTTNTDSSFEDMKKRVSVEEQKVSKNGITKTFDAIMKDGVPVARLSEVWTGSGGKQWYVAPLKARKRKSYLEPFEELVPPCSTKEDAIEKMTMRLFNEEQEEKAKKAASAERAKKILEAKRQAAISNASESTRNEVANALYTGEDVVKSTVSADYKFTPSETTVTLRNEKVTAKDYTDAIPKNVVLVNKKNILTEEKPSYIPDVSEDAFERMEYRIEGVKLGQDRYLIITNRAGYRALSMLDKTNKTYAVVNLAVLIATQDYYYKKAKAVKEKKAEEEREEANKIVSIARKMGEKESVEGIVDTMSEFKDVPLAEKMQYEREASFIYKNWKMNQANHPESVFTLEKQIGYYMDRVERVAKKTGRVTSVGKNKATLAHLSLIQVANDLSSQREAWKPLREYLADMKQGSVDMELQMEDDQSTYQKGRETSYGRKGSLTYLQDSHGVLVKRQSGDEMTTFEVDEVKKALDSVYSVFGDRSELAKKSKLLISHSGEKRMHASKFLGIYIPARSAIGVTWGMGTAEAGFTLSHEFAHFMDNKLGEKTGRTHFASDDPTSIENKIASTFRDNMKTAQDSDYQNRTCECFARALEQYYVTETGNDKLYQDERNTIGNHPEQKVYMEKVYPLVKKFFEEKGEMLKSIRVWRFTK